MSLQIYHHLHQSHKAISNSVALFLSLTLIELLLFLMMLKAEICVRSQISGFGSFSSSDQYPFLTHSSNLPNPCRTSLKFSSLSTSKQCHKSSFVCCKSHSNGKFHTNSFNSHPHEEYLEASLLIPETVKHYHLRKQGFREVKKLAGQAVPFSAQVKYFKNNLNSIGLSTLRRFQHPTIFLKISCEGDFLLPITVGEFALEKLIDSLNEDGHEGYPNQFKFVKNLANGLGNEVRMVKITERVANTYIARLYFGKLGKRENFSVDARPSDAINLAQRCEAPIYVNKQIVLSDAIRISYGTGRVLDTKPIYDVLLDSPLDGPDLLVEEFNIVQNMNSAVKEERYKDAAMWRDKLLVMHRDSGIRGSHRKKWHEGSIPELP